MGDAAEAVWVSETDTEAEEESLRKRTFRNIIHATRRYLRRIKALRDRPHQEQEQEQEEARERPDDPQAMDLDQEQQQQQQQQPPPQQTTTQRLRLALDDLTFPGDAHHQAHPPAHRAHPQPQTPQVLHAALPQQAEQRQQQLPQQQIPAQSQSRGRKRRARKGKSKGKGKAASTPQRTRQSTGRMLGPEEYFRQQAEVQMKAGHMMKGMQGMKGGKRMAEHMMIGKGKGDDYAQDIPGATMKGKLMKGGNMTKGGMKGVDMMTHTRMKGQDMRKGKANGGHMMKGGKLGMNMPVGGVALRQPVSQPRVGMMKGMQGMKGFHKGMAVPMTVWVNPMCGPW